MAGGVKVRQETPGAVGNAPVERNQAVLLRADMKAGDGGPGALGILLWRVRKAVSILPLGGRSAHLTQGVAAAA